METGAIVSWAKSEGDKVAEGDLLAEIETDKATMSLEATDPGIVAKILIEAGTKDIPIGTELCVIVEEESAVSAFKDYKPSKAPAKGGESQKKEESKADQGKQEQESAPPSAEKKAKSKEQSSAEEKSQSSSSQRQQQQRQSSSGGERVFLSPMARRLAEEQKIPLENLSGLGSGPWGEVRAADVKQFVESGGSRQAAAGQGSGGQQRVQTPGSSFAELSVSGMRATIAKRLSQSKQTIPHYYLTVDIVLDEVMALRERINARLQREAGGGGGGKDKDKKAAAAKLSVNDFLIKAAAKACQQVPECNSSWMDTFIRQYSTVDISIAVATPSGLITPIVTSAESKGLKAINEDVLRLAEKARAGKLQPQEYQGGTFTISNLGMFGVKSFSAIINPPQACILAVGSSEQRVVPDDQSPDGFRTRSLLTVTLCCDHRVVDGAVGARWLQQFKQYLEDPSSMLL